MPDRPELQATVIRLPDGEVINSEGHQIKIEQAEIQMLGQTFYDQAHLSVIVDQVMVALYSRWRVQPPFTLILTKCTTTDCICQFTRLIYASALFSDTDITPSLALREELNALEAEVRS